VNPRTLQVRNAAAVMVTASLPAFARQGARIEAQVSSMGDAKSLQGGTLVLTPLFAPDGQVYAVAQGALSLGGGFSIRTLGAAAQKSHPTVALLTDGALVEREVPVELGAGGSLRVALYRPDFTTAERVSNAVNGVLGRRLAQATDAGTITLDVNGASPEAIVDMVTSIEQAEVTPDTAARVVLNERTGTVIIGQNVRLMPVAIAHGSLQVTVKNDFGVSQPAPFSEGETVVVPDSTIGVEEGKPKSIVALKAGTSLGDLVTGLNALGVTPQDLIAILQAVGRPVRSRPTWRSCSGPDRPATRGVAGGAGGRRAGEAPDPGGGRPADAGRILDAAAGSSPQDGPRERLAPEVAGARNLRWSLRSERCRGAGVPGRTRHGTCSWD
jgi:flagellar P-ring protein precursor FlgI